MILELKFTTLRIAIIGNFRFSVLRGNITLPYSKIDTNIFKIHR